MGTRICKGILHTEGIELPEEEFYLRRELRYSKRASTFYIYTYYKNICKRCECEAGNYSSPGHQKYIHKSDYATKHRKHANDTKHRQIAELRDSYIKTVLTPIGYNNEEIYPELINLKRSQLKLYRKLKNIKSKS